MPTNRTRRKRQSLLAALDGFTKRHLLGGDCLSCCVICAPYWHPPQERLLRPEAREYWERHRSRLLEQWYNPDATDHLNWGDTYGLGRYGIPSFGEVFFDDLDMPEPNPSWSDKAHDGARQIMGAVYVSVEGR